MNQIWGLTLEGRTTLTTFFLGDVTLSFLEAFD